MCCEVGCEEFDTRTWLHFTVYIFTVCPLNIAFTESAGENTKVTGLSLLRVSVSSYEETLEVSSYATRRYVETRSNIPWPGRGLFRWLST